MRKTFLLIPLLFFVMVTVFAQENEAQFDTVTTVVTSKSNEAPTFSIIKQKDLVDVRKLPQDKVDELKRSDDYWYANMEPKKKEEPKQEVQTGTKSIFEYAWFRNLLWIVILCSFIAVVIWYLASSNIGLFRKSSKKINDETEEDTLDEDIFNIQYGKEIEKAVSAKNYRLAVRLWYLQTLLELTSRNFIVYSNDRTNSDYVNKLFGGPYYHDFFRLTRNFEYAWYGGFTLSEEAYNLLQADFLKFKNALTR
ncbi:hypothetical protein [Flavisolibacter ginsenosidimutans]|uniref:DUF4129 domain-containing protein n=1 Tax=Flavisolibacter ginsenosidimutans TaxID=661481 RepID=A0A5B8UFA5_9BACT|nr:hypothetical protein [Flavisolibacter ginsenosidimutans]QEC55153.1 hypothetical protein FSB75_04275 [Flavisolibacter ginsenosidimutans]